MCESRSAGAFKISIDIFTTGIISAIAWIFLSRALIYIITGTIRKVFVGLLFVYLDSEFRVRIWPEALA